LGSLNYVRCHDRGVWHTRE